MSILRNKLTYTQIIVISFFLTILFGAFLLTLPLSSQDGCRTPFIDALFTATSSTCVTGLIVFDTYTHWSGFGQAIILSLIQIGGLGVMTCVAALALIFNRSISIGERRLLMQSAGSLQHSGIVQLLYRILRGTALVELCGASLLSIAFIPKMGFAAGLWNAVFHSVSAFCNAGFDIMGKYGPFSSFCTPGLADNPLVILTLAFLIIIGGIGFIVWTDFDKKRFNFKEFELHSKIVLTATAFLIIVGTILFFIFENNYSLSGMSFWEKLLHSFFQSVSPRTAGFNSVSLSSLRVSSALLMIILMFIGGSPGSTAGGIKTTTFMVLLLGAWANARGYGNITIFKRKLDNGTMSQASAIATIYAAAVIISVMIIGALEPYSLTQILFETVSAVGTVGLSMGITPSLCNTSRIILILLMFSGRVGGLTFVLTLAERRLNIPVNRPTSKILIG